MGRRLAAGNRPVAVTGRSERGLMGRDLHLGYADRTGVWASLVGIHVYINCKMEKGEDLE